MRLWGWEGGCRSGDALATGHRLCGLYRLKAHVRGISNPPKLTIGHGQPLHLTCFNGCLFNSTKHHYVDHNPLDSASTWTHCDVILVCWGLLPSLGPRWVPFCPRWVPLCPRWVPVCPRWVPFCPRRVPVCPWPAWTLLEIENLPVLWYLCWWSISMQTVMLNAESQRQSRKSED